jgi:hypothetical protein
VQGHGVSGRWGAQCLDTDQLAFCSPSLHLVFRTPRPYFCSPGPIIWTSALLEPEDQGPGSAGLFPSKLVAHCPYILYPFLAQALVSPQFYQRPMPAVHRWWDVSLLYYYLHTKECLFQGPLLEDLPLVSSLAFLKSLNLGHISDQHRPQGAVYTEWFCPKLPVNGLLLRLPPHSWP